MGAARRDEQVTRQLMLEPPSDFEDGSRHSRRSRNKAERSGGGELCGALPGRLPAGAAESWAEYRISEYVLL